MDICRPIEAMAGQTPSTRLVGNTHHIPTMKKHFKDLSHACCRPVWDLALPPRWATDGLFEFRGEGGALVVSCRATGNQHEVPPAGRLKDSAGELLGLEDLVMHENYRDLRATIMAKGGLASSVINIVRLGELSPKMLALTLALPLNPEPEPEKTLAIADTTSARGQDSPTGEAPSAIEDVNQPMLADAANARQRILKKVAEEAWCPQPADGDLSNISKKQPSPACGIAPCCVAKPEPSSGDAVKDEIPDGPTKAARLKIRWPTAISRMLAAAIAPTACPRTTSPRPWWATWSTTT